MLISHRRKERLLFDSAQPVYSAQPGSLRFSTRLPPADHSLAQSQGHRCRDSFI